jgi:hypothetical protein
MKMNNWQLLVSIAVLGTSIACGASTTPTSPASTSLASGEAGASGETLKIGAPTPTSPIGGIQLTEFNVVLNFTGVAGSFATFTPSYEIELRNAGGTVIANPTITTTSYPVTASLALDSNHSWRVRAVYQGKVGPWSATATFKTQVAAFISGNTIYDPLTLGTTVGTRVGPTTFIAGQGLRLEDHSSYVQYNLPTTLQAGQFSMMILGADEGSAGEKSKVFAMKEGDGLITDNDYRMTAELRARNYVPAGAVTFRIISGDAGDEHHIHDGTRVPLVFSSSRWYFWSFTWQTGQASMTVREDNEAGRVIYSQTIGMSTRAYRPIPHRLMLGTSPGRAGDLDNTIGGGPIYKNVYAGPAARPSFPAIIANLFGSK